MKEHTPADTQARTRLIQRLQELEQKSRLGGSATEDAHAEADQALLTYINDEDVTRTFDRIMKWYA